MANIDLTVQVQDVPGGKHLIKVAVFALVGPDGSLVQEAQSQTVIVDVPVAAAPMPSVVLGTPVVS